MSIDEQMTKLGIKHQQKDCQVCPVPLSDIEKFDLAKSELKQQLIKGLPSLIGIISLITLGMLIMLSAMLIDGAVTWQELLK